MGSAPPDLPPQTESPYAALYGTPQQWAVLHAVAPAVQSAMDHHFATRRLWMPGDILPADCDGGDPQEAFHAELRERARALPDAVRVSVALNLLTEEGLPHFHRLIAQHFGTDGPWGTWNNHWTAEEDRHGCLLRDYVRDARLFRMKELEPLQYAYIAAGFNPAWEQDPYRLIAYTSLQERATQIAHANTGRLAAAHEPVLQRALAHLAGDEGRHYRFYRGVFAAILAADPSGAVLSLSRVMANLEMPGHAAPGFAEMSELVRRQGIFGPRPYAAICRELLAFWGLADLEGLSGAASEARDRLMEVPARLERIDDLASRRARPRVFSFPFVPGREVRL